MTEDEKQIELVQVRIVKSDGESVLIETEGRKRFYVPKDSIENKRIDRAELDKAIPHGIQWEAYLDLEPITTERLALMLRRAGIYTLADLQRRDRQLIRIGTKLIGEVVQEAAQRADKAKPPRRK